MAEYVGGEQKAFDELFARYAPMLLNIMRKYVGNEDDARDNRSANIPTHASGAERFPARRAPAAPGS